MLTLNLVFRVPETATTLLRYIFLEYCAKSRFTFNFKYVRLTCFVRVFSGGVTFSDLTAPQAFQFQMDILLVMLRIENTFFNLAESEAEHGQNCIVLCDRGTMDASACFA